jgi:hypothetical protein
MDAANLLKPALARGELHAIGATTLKEYQKYIEKDKALERRFQEVYVEEPRCGFIHLHPAWLEGEIRGSPRSANQGRCGHCLCPSYPIGTFQIGIYPIRP